MKREAGGVNNLFLPALTHRKDAVQRDIIDKIPKGEGEYIIRTYPK
jgi:hypothetical protein